MVRQERGVIPSHAVAQSALIGHTPCIVFLSAKRPFHGIFSITEEPFQGDTLLRNILFM